MQAREAHATFGQRACLHDLVDDGPLADFCRFDLVESAGGPIEGWLGLCGIGTDGVFSGSVDAGGGVALRIVAPDDIGCETYHIDGLANVTVKGRAITVLAPTPGSTLGLPLTVQRLVDDACFGATFTTATVNAPDRLEARHGQ